MDPRDLAAGEPRVTVNCYASGTVTALDKPRKENAQLLPSFLPDGRHFLYLRMFGGVESQTGIYIGSIDSKPEGQNATRLMAAGQNAVYAPSPGSGTGHVLFLRDGLLMAQPFAEGRLSTIGDAAYQRLEEELDWSEQGWAQVVGRE